MDKKYRVNDLAKDLNVSTNDITEVVQEYFGVQKKSQASLSEEELSGELLYQVSGQYLES